MPSLSALQEFKTSFNDIGGEKAALEAKNIPLNDLELPDTEAAPMESGEAPDANTEPDAVNRAEEPAESAEPAVEPESSGLDLAAGGDFDFGDLLGAMPDDLAPPTAPPEALTPEALPADETSADSDTEILDLDGESLDLGGESLDLGGESPDLGGEPDAAEDSGGEAPDKVPDGVPDEVPNFELPDFEIPETSAESAGEAPDEGLNLDGESLDLGGESLDLGGEPAVAEDSGGEAPDESSDEVPNEVPDFELPDFEIPETSAESAGETPEEGLDLDGESLDLGGESLDLDGESLDLGGEPAAAEDSGGEAPDEVPNEVPDFELPDFEIPETSAEPAGETPEEEAGIESAGIDISGDLLDNNAFDSGGAEAAGGGEAGDAFDNFNLDGEAFGAEQQAGTGAGIGAEGDADVPDIEDFGDEFSLPGIDDLLAKPGAGAKPAGPKAGGPSRAGAKKEEVPEEVEEIRLTDEELQAFQKNLAGYPLNLRVACEELIVEQAVPPEQMSRLIKMLVRGAPARETAALAGKILGKTIDIPKGFEKSTGEALEAEQASFAYIFTHNFLPVLRLFTLIAVLAGCVIYLIYRFIYTPLKAESIYKIGYERIFAGEYERANERFSEAFSIKRVKDWFYRYAEAFRDERQYYRAEAKYDELLRYYPRDKKGVLDYAALETNYLFNYQKANNLLQRELLDYAPNDFEGLLAYGDNNLAWGEVDPSKYDDARFAYARLMQEYGWTSPVVERMMKFFIRTDNLKETLPLYAWFANDPKRKLSAETMAELGGYLLDKQLEEVRGVPNEYAGQIEGVRALLLNAVRANPALPEPHYHLARYYRSLDNAHEERVTLEVAIRAFDAAREEPVRRRAYRIDAHLRYANNLINSREFMPAEEQLIRGVNLYEDALSRRLISRAPEYGRLYAGLGDLEYFTKTGDMEAALNYYHQAERNGWAPPEMQYRMGAAYYQLEDWKNALEYLFTASSSLPLNRRLLFALGNTALKRGDYFAAQGYYNRLLDILETQRARLPVLLPNDRPEYLELAERLMMARNNAGVNYEALAGQTGDRRYRVRAQALYVEANRAWDARTRDPRTMIRSGSIPLPYLNSRNTLYPQSGYEPQIFIRIDRDVLEPSRWEELAPMAGLE